ncbi:unnamed protein product [Cunninghamella blakesleeana]
MAIEKEIGTTTIVEPPKETKIKIVKENISPTKTQSTEIKEYKIEEDKVKVIRTTRNTSIFKNKDESSASELVDEYMSKNNESNITSLITPSSNIPIKRKAMDDSTNLPNLSLYTQYKSMNMAKLASIKELSNNEVVIKDNFMDLKNDKILKNNDKDNNYGNNTINSYDDTYNNTTTDNNNEDDNNRNNSDINNNNDKCDSYTFLTPALNLADILNYNHPNHSTNINNLGEPKIIFRKLTQLHSDNTKSNIDNDANNSKNTTTHQPNSELVIIKEAYIDRLSNDSLFDIFKYLSNTSDYCIFASVCRRWNKIVNDPYLWRRIYYNWTKFVHQHQLINDYYVKHKKLPLPLIYVRRMNIENNYDLEKLTITPVMPLFENLKELHLSYFYLDDILDLILTMANIETLQCYQIMTRLPVESVMLAAFAKLKQLKVLELEFKEICEHIKSTSLSNDRRPQFKLPSTLRILNVKNICDMEEIFFQRIFNTDYKRNEMTTYEMNRIVHSWTKLEDDLLRKYQLLGDLHCLSELSLGFCRGFTAKVWRECIQPCTKSLKKLTLYGWNNNNGYLENPKKRLERKLLFDMVNNGTDTSNHHHHHHISNNDNISNTNTNNNNEQITIDDYVDDAEKAIMETIEGLRFIEYLSFNEFQCGYGLIYGLKSLLNSKSLTIHHLSFSNDNPSLFSSISIEHLDLFLNTNVNKFDILVADKQ